MTVDPLYINGLLGSLSVVLLASLATLPLAARLTQFRGPGRALALTPALGVLLLTAIAALLYYLLPPTNAAWIATLLTVALGVALWSRRFDQIATLPRNWVHLAAGIVVAAALLVSIIANHLTAPIPDESLHLGISATITAGNYPVVFPGAPDFALARPYAVDLHLALLTAVTGLPVGFAAGFQHAWLALASLLVVFALVRHATKSVAAAVIAAGLAAGAPGALALGWPALGPDGAMFPAGFTALIDWFAEDGFKVADLPAGSANLIVPQRLLGLALAALLLQGWIIRLHASRGGALVLGLGAGLLALVDIGLFFLALLTLAALLAVEVARAGDAPPIATRAAITLLAALLPTALLGGAITDALLRGAPGDIITLEPHLHAALLDPRALATSAQPGHPALGLNLAWLHLFIIAVGLWLLLRRRAMSALLLAGVAGIVLAHLFAFNPAGEASGAVAYSGFFTVLAIVIGAHAGLRRLPHRPAVAASALLILFVALPTALPRLVPAVRNTVAGIDWRPPPPAAAQPAYDWIVANLPHESRILSPTPAALTIATGRYGVFTNADWNRDAPYPGSDFIDRWSDLDGVTLGSLGVTHLHIPTRDLDRLPAAARDALTDPARFELVFVAFDARNPEDGQRIYRVRAAANARSADPSRTPAQLGPGPAGE